MGGVLCSFEEATVAGCGLVGVFKKRARLRDETINFAEILIRQPLWGGAVDDPAAGATAVAVGRLHRATRLLCASRFILQHLDQ